MQLGWMSAFMLATAFKLGLPLQLRKLAWRTPLSRSWVDEVVLPFCMYGLHQHNLLQQHVSWSEETGHSQDCLRESFMMLHLVHY